MLQTPSKYHPNPLSHFLALQSHQQIQNQNHHHHQQFNGSNLNGNLTTSLDVGKSFTIAAILGLQKNAVDNSHHHHHHHHHQKDYNSVMNLSLNNNNNNHFNHHHHHHKSNNINKEDSSNSNGFNNVNNIECDNVNSNNAISKYYSETIMKSANINQNHQIRHHFAAAAAHHTTAVAAAAAAAINVGVPSALQSLQQLHQHHTQQASLSFQNREKAKSDHLSNKKPSLKSKRVRTIFTPEQLERLEAEFERQQYMVGPERLYLAHTLQLTEAQVKVWFQNRRIKWRKHHLEVTQQRLALMRQTQTLPCNENNPTTTNNTSVINQLNHVESELSICNDSIDDESFTESDEI